MLLRGGEAPQEVLATRDARALAAGPRRDLALAMAGREIGIGLFLGHLGRPALDPDLDGEVGPVDAQRHLVRSPDLAALGAPQVRVEDESPFVDPPEEHDSRLR